MNVSKTPKLAIALASDHACIIKNAANEITGNYKDEIKKVLESKGYSVIDLGTHGSESCDYPDFAHKVAESVEQGNAERGVLICGTGQGMAMTANKHPGIRAGEIYSEQHAEEIAALIRQHNDANILCLGARFLSLQTAHRIIQIFLETPFEAGRHESRVKKIPIKSKIISGDFPQSTDPDPAA